MKGMQQWNTTINDLVAVDSEHVEVCWGQCLQCHQSVNQISIAPISPAQWRDSWIGVQQQNQWSSSVTSTGHRVCWCQRGIGQVKEMCRDMFLKGSNWNDWMDRQRQVVPKRRAQEWKALRPVLVLTLRTDGLIPLFDLSERDGSDAASMEWR